MVTLEVSLTDRHYPIHIGRGLLNQVELLLPYLSIPHVAIITNTVVAPLYLKSLQNTLEAAEVQCVTATLPDGEYYKNWETLNHIFDTLLLHYCERKTTLMALGGGVIGDITGFAAACYQRGTPYVQIPTTLLAQVDSSVGGKTAINHGSTKNMIGAFYQPQIVLIDLELLNTLPDRELTAGFAEVIKYALLGDSQFFEWLEEHMEALSRRDTYALEYAITRCCTMKANIVAHDEKEQGERILLNLGHTFGHAIEACTGFGTWLHGEAVAVGMVLAAAISHELGWLSWHTFNRIRQLIQRAGLPVRIPNLGAVNWKKQMSHDKKVEQGTIRFVLLKQLGQAVVKNDLPYEIVDRVLMANYLQ